MKATKWTEQEEQFLLDNYKKIGIINCSKSLNKSKTVVFRKFYQLIEPESKKSVIWAKDKVKFLINNYHELGSLGCEKVLKIHRLQIEKKAANLHLVRDFNSVENGFKICGICKDKKTLSEFNFHYRHLNKYQYKCKNCKKIYDKAEKIKRLSNPESQFKHIKSSLLNGSKHRAKNKNLDFNLDKEWIENNLTKNCPVTGDAYDFANGIRGKISIKSPSIDRIDNNKGYTKDNCIIVSFKVNMSKNACSWRELRQIADFYEELENKKLTH